MKIAPLILVFGFTLLTVCPPLKAAIDLRGFRMTTGVHAQLDCSSLLSSLNPHSRKLAQELAISFLQNRTGPAWNSEFSNWMRRVKHGESVLVWQFKGMSNIRAQLKKWTDASLKDPHWRGVTEASYMTTAQSLLADSESNQLDEHSYYWREQIDSIGPKFIEIGLLIEFDIETFELVMTVFANP